MLVTGITSFFIFAGIFISPISVISNFDPVCCFLDAHFPAFIQGLPKHSYLLLLLFRLSITRWVTLEASRLGVTIMVPITSIFSIYLSCIEKLTQFSLNFETLRKYQQIHCINHITIDIHKRNGGCLTGISIILFVFGNWIVISGWYVYPTGLYLMTTGFILVQHIFVAVTLPLIIKSNEMSEEMICSWKLQALEQCNKTYWRRVIKAQRPVAFYYAMTKFERDTKVNYYSTILDHTINLLLVY